MLQDSLTWQLKVLAPATCPIRTPSQHHLLTYVLRRAANYKMFAKGRKISHFRKLSSWYRTCERTVNANGVSLSLNALAQRVLLATSACNA